MGNSSGKAETATPIPDWAGYRRFRDAFAGVMDPEHHTPEWLDGEILSGRVKFLRGMSAAIVFERREYPTGAADVHGLVAAGDLAEIVEYLIPEAEEWGRAHGCTGAVIESRQGWVKALAPSGYAPHQVALRKVL